MQRWEHAGPWIFALLGAGLQVTGWTEPWIGMVLIGIALLWSILLVPAVADRLLPRVHMRRGAAGEGVGMTFRPPPGGKRKRLNKEVAALVADLHDYLRTAPSANSRYHQEQQRMIRATSEEERSRLWWQARDQDSAEDEQRRRELAALFGGRVMAALAAFQRLGLITESDAQSMQWKLGSLHFMKELAVELDALRRQL